MLACMLSFQSRPTLCDPTDYSPPGSPSMGSSRQEYWSGLPCPPQEKLHCYCEIKWKEGKKKEKEKWYERGREGKLEIHLFFLSHSLGILICQHPLTGWWHLFILPFILPKTKKQTDDNKYSPNQSKQRDELSPYLNINFFQDIEHKTH